MKKIYLLLCLLTANCAVFPQSQLTVFPDWLSTTGSQNFFQKNVTKTDASGNIYVAGATVNGSGNYDILVAKYSSAGTQLWIQQYNGAGNGNDIACGLYIDGSGNVYITGAVTTATNIDAVTIKYNSSGTQQWLSTYNGTGSLSDVGTDVYVDASGYVYISGTSYNASGNTDIIAIRYKSDGTQDWVARYDYTSNLNDAGLKIAVSTTVTVTGGVTVNAGHYNYCAVQFNKGTGAYITIKTGTGTTSVDLVNDMVQDASGNIYIAASKNVTGQGYDWDIIKLNSTLAPVWEHTYNSANLDDVANGISIDASGNVYVTGYTTSSTQGKNITTLKYNSGGTQQWVQNYNDALNGDDEANAIALNSSGEVFITGYVSTAIDKADYFTAKYNSSGTMLWSIHNDGNAHLIDKSTNIAIDNNGDVVVTGESETTPGVYQYCTVKYVERQIITPTDYNSENPAANSNYYENKGQIKTTQDSLVPTIRYYLPNSSPKFYIKKNSFSFVFAHVDTVASTNDTLHRIDATFEEINSASKTYAMDEQSSYLNYYLPQCPNGVTEVHGAQRLVTYSLYNNIDLVYSSNQDGIKCYFVIKPGGNPANIKMDFTGASSFNLDGTTNALTVNSSVGNITFERPTAYQLSSTNTLIPITGWQCAWQTNGASNKYKFYTGTYDNAKALIIQVDRGHSTFTPTSTGNIDWCTYYGGTKDDEFLKIKTDANGQVYITGYTSSTDFPTYSGQYIHPFTPDDAIMLKFNNAGVRQWAIYYGGDSNDNGNSIAVDASKYVYITGHTWSSNLPLDDTLSSAYMQYTNAGGGDAFIVKLDSNGWRNTHTWATYFGGTDYEEGWDLKIDGNNNLYMVGTGTSATPQHTQTGSYNNMNNGTGLIAKFNSNDALVWSAIYAGTEKIKSIAIDPTNTIFITGSANSSQLPLAEPTQVSYIDSFYSTGSTDAFIANLSSGNAITWSTYYGGNDKDIANAIAIDNYYIYLTGNTLSSNFPFYYPGYPAYIDSIIGGYDDIFVLRFRYVLNAEGGPEFKRNWSTFYGGSGIFEVGNDIAVDNSGIIYVTGSAPNVGFPLKNLYNGYNNGTFNSSGAGEAFVLAFASNLTRIWSTYLGGEGNDRGWGIITDNANSKLYLTGTTSSLSYDFPIVNLGGTPAAWWQPANAAIDHTTDGFITRFNLAPVIVAAGINDDEINTKNKDFIVYPNPSNGNVSLEINLDKPDNIIISIYNTMGERVYDEVVNNAYGLFQKNINISGLSNGIYFVQIKAIDSFICKKIIKQ